MTYSDVLGIRIWASEHWWGGIFEFTTGGERIPFGSFQLLEDREGEVRKLNQRAEEPRLYAGTKETARSAVTWPPLLRGCLGVGSVPDKSEAPMAADRRMGSKLGLGARNPWSLKALCPMGAAWARESPFGASAPPG